MKIFTLKNIFSAALVVTSISIITPSQAMPAFARQTGKACLACHFQHYPALNDYGTEFKASGYTQKGKQKLLKGKDLSLPAVFNASLFLKLRYQKKAAYEDSQEDIYEGEIQFPDEFALLAGGRLSENAGFMLEAQLMDGEAPAAAGLKIPMMYSVADETMKAGVVPFTTDGLSAAYGFELFNTGAVRNVRVSEHRKDTSAQQYVGVSSGEATGLAFVLWHPEFFVNASSWMPVHLPGADSGSGKLESTYFRAAYTPTIGAWSTGIGFQVWGGSDVITAPDPDPSSVERGDTKGFAVDAQAQGMVSDMPLGLYLTHASADASDANTTNFFNSGVNEKTASVILAELGVLPNQAAISLAFRRANNGTATDSDDDAFTLGGTYQMAQNIQLQLAHTSYSNEKANETKSLSTFMFSVGF